MSHPDLADIIRNNAIETRKALRISPEELARRIARLGGQVSNQMIRRFEDRGGVQADKLIWIAWGLGVDYVRMFDGVPRMKDLELAGAGLVETAAQSDKK